MAIDKMAKPLPPTEGASKYNQGVLRVTSLHRQTGDQFDNA